MADCYKQILLKKTGGELTMDLWSNQWNKEFDNSVGESRRAGGGSVLH